MLVLSRKPDEAIIIDGRITVRVLEVRGDRIRLGIEAPREVAVHREEVAKEIRTEECGSHAWPASDRQTASSVRG